MRQAEPVVWEVLMLSYQQKTGKLDVRVIDYTAELNDRFFTQEPKKPIRSLVFDRLDKSAFQAQLSYYNAQKLAPFLTELEEPSSGTLFNDQPVPSSAEVHPVVRDTWSTPYILEGMKEGQLREEFQIPLLTTHFELGQIKAPVWVEAVNEPLDILLLNDTILPEFDHIKSFFVQALQTATIQIQAEIEIQDGRIISHVASSPEVDRINDDLIGVVRSLRAQGLTKPPVVLPVDKEVFTDEELFEAFREEISELGNVYREEPDQVLLEELLDGREVRNRKQLLYLAGKLHDPSAKIRFTLAPLFGFIFKVKGELMDHYIWELLNSHATYIWSMDKTQGASVQQYREIEKVISLIRAQGRQHYRQHHQLVHDFDFHLVTHQYAGSAVKDHFPRWKHRLLEHLI